MPPELRKWKNSACSSRLILPCVFKRAAFIMVLGATGVWAEERDVCSDMELGGGIY